MEEIALPLKELLYPSIADVAALSVDVNIGIARVAAQCTAAAPPAQGAGRGPAGFTVSTCGFPLMRPVLDEALHSGCGSVGWSEAVLASLSALAGGVSRSGPNAADLHKVASLAFEHRNLLDAITEPRLRTGDLRTVH